MRILWLAAHYPPDLAASGATLQTHRLAQRVAASEHELLVLAGSINQGLVDGETRTDRVDGVDVCWIGTSGWTGQDDDRNWDNPTITATVEILLDRFQPDLVHAHMLQGFGVGAVRASLDRGIRTIVTMRDMWWWCPRLFLVDRYVRPCPLVTDVDLCECAGTAEWRAHRVEALRRTLDRVDEILVPSEAMRRLVIANGVDPARVTADPNDIDIEFGAARPPTSDGVVRFVYIGGNPAVKGFDVMRRAASRLRDRGGWHLTMYGVTGRRRPPPRHVTFAPYFDHDRIHEILAEADVMIIPSVMRESYSNVAREALGAGLAVVTSDCIGPQEVVHDGENGLVVPTGDDRALADAMRRLVDDRELLRALRSGADASKSELLRDPDEHAASLIARYGAAPHGQPPYAPRRVDYVVGTDARVPGPARNEDDSVRYRVHHAVEAARLLGATTGVHHVLDERLDTELTGADAVVVHEVPATDELLRTIDAVRTSGATVIYDAAGAPFDPAGVNDADAALARRRHTTLLACDGAFAATPLIAEHVERITGTPTVVVPTTAGLRELRASAERSPARPTVRERARRRLTTRNDPLARPTVTVVLRHREDATEWIRVEPYVVEAVDAHPTADLKILVTAGAGSIGGLPDTDRSTGIVTTTTWSETFEHLARSYVVLAPTSHSTVASGAELFTWVEAALAGVPVITGSTPVTTAAISHGATGWLARTDPQWGDLCTDVLRHPAARRTVAAAAERQVTIEHGPHVLAAALRRAFDEARGWRRSRHDRREGLVAPAATGSASPIPPY